MDRASQPDLPLHLVHAAGSPFASVLAMIRRIGASRSNAVICGPPGTGKETLARLIHTSGAAGIAELVAVQCRVAEPDALAELLSRAHAAKAGHPCGTLYLEDVDELSLPAQARLVRALDGAGLERFRVVAASTRDLNGDVLAARFRRDLYDLLACRVQVPALRDRRGDVLALFDRCWGELRPGSALAPSARALLTAYSWPGNVREVQAVAQRVAASTRGPEVSRRDVERAVLAGTSDGAWLSQAPEDDERASPVDPAGLTAIGIDLPAPAGAYVDLNAILRRVEGDLIQWALERSGGCKASAASMLGLRRTTFTEKLKRFDAGGAGRPGASAPAAALARQGGDS